jgi:hypothetical protein
MVPLYLAVHVTPEVAMTERYSPPADPPVGKTAYPAAAQAEPMAAPPLTAAEQETLDMLYAELKPMAISGAREYVLARTPVYLNAAMQDKINADFPPPPEADAAVAASRRADLDSYSRTAQAPAAPAPVHHAPKHG